MLVSVVLDIPTQTLDGAFTYAVPAEIEHLDLIGRAVVVPWGHRYALGFVLETHEDTYAAEAGISFQKIKPLCEVASDSFFTEQGAACAQWLSHYYVAPLSSCVRLFVPPAAVPKVVQHAGGYTLEQPAVGQVDDRWATLGPAGASFVPRKGSYKQEAVLAAVRKGDVRVSELAAEYGAVSAALNALEKKGAICIEKRRRMRGPLEVAGEHSSIFRVDVEKPTLNAQQQVAVDAITGALQRSTGEVVLLDGVTGSGKTEVYLRTIEQAIQLGKRAIVLVPEISLTPQTVARFRGRFGDSVAVMHSRMSMGERYDQWDLIKNGGAQVVVGARSALFTPLPDTGIIIIDEEHEGSYKQDSSPRYHARDVALWMAQRTGAVVVLGSATPSIESLHAAQQQSGWHHVVLSERANGRPMPTVDVVDMAHEFASGHRSMFSRPLIAALKEELAADHKVVLLLNQRGFAKFLLCRDCGFVPTCDSCSTSLTYHETNGSLVCHHCGATHPAPAVCPKCGSPYLKKFGAGTQRVEADLRALLQSIPEIADTVVVRMDADTTKTKGAHQKLLEEFATAERSVLLGTQMIAKGLDFDTVTLVGVINADTTLHLPDYRAAERTFDLVEQVAGRAGRADLPGRVIVQTYDAETPALRAAQTYQRQILLDDELPKRELLGYPPYTHMANILIWGEDESEVATYAQELYTELLMTVESSREDVTIFPATPCLLSKLKNAYRWHILFTCDPAFSLGDVLEPFFRSRKSCKTVRVSVDIDPQSLL